ncbi:MAG TPA: type IV pilus modification protein PilV [Gammaproteobacteria bacterium]|nr:type IV pilus modification protein PilV [Gammaproteobacteria bacterium]
MTLQHHIDSGRFQRGFTLIEVLVAVIVLSIGLLGLAGLQATGLKNNHSAYLRSQAVTYAYDITDRMRANRNSAIGGNYNFVAGNAIPSGSGIAQSDLAEWLTSVRNNLPGGDASVVVNGRSVVIDIQWDDSRAGGASQQHFVFNSEI